MNKRAQLIWNTFVDSFPESACTLVNEKPERLVIRGILSAQCTDVRVNLTCDDLFQTYPSIQDIDDLSEEEIASLIRPCGLIKGKSKAIKVFANKYINEWNETVPNDIDLLMTVPGIGKKIANLIVGEVYGTPALVVDTHCKRVMYRMGLTKSSDPLKVEKDVTAVFDPECYIRLGHMAVDLGRSYCHAKNPSCDICPMINVCKRRIDK